jgi:Protein of unknown function (DUF3738)
MIRASVMVLMSSAIFGQAARFEVASIKPTLAGRPRQVQSCAGGRFTTRGTPIAWILKWSYGLADYQLRDGGPSWLNSFDTYDIEAEAAPPVTETQCRSMVQTLIKERFKLRAHRETIQVSAYALVLGKSGFKLHDRGRVRINGAVKQDLWEAEPPDGWTMSRLGNYLAGGLHHRPPCVGSDRAGGDLWVRPELLDEGGRRSSQRVHRRTGTTGAQAGDRQSAHRDVRHRARGETFGELTPKAAGLHLCCAFLIVVGRRPLHK